MRYTLRLEWRNRSNDLLLMSHSKIEIDYIKSQGGKVRKEDRYKPRKPWVAKILGPHEHYEFEREFLDGDADYSDSNSKGSRGVYLTWHLSDGYYECRTSQDERQYFTVYEGNRYNLELEDVQVWANNI